MLKIRPYPLIRGLASYVLPSKLFKRPGSGGTVSAEYCYSVWLRHLHYLFKNELFKSLSDIKRVAEIGPGDSIGIGLAAIYTGAEEYYAFDVIEHANLDRNRFINRQLLHMFVDNLPIPNTERQRNTAPTLDNYKFPKEILYYPKEYYYNRYDLIDSAMLNQKQVPINIKYIVPWMNSNCVELEGLDLIFSQAVMEHVSEIEFAYSEMYKWLRPGGVISHQIDFKAHEMTKTWNGHWYIGDKMWTILSHGRKYPINRLPLSTHVKMIKKAGFEIKYVKPVLRENPHKSEKTKVSGINFSDDDLITSGALIQAIRH